MFLATDPIVPPVSVPLVMAGMIPHIYNSFGGSLLQLANLKMHEMPDMPDLSPV